MTLAVRFVSSESTNSAVVSGSLTESRVNFGPAFSIEILENCPLTCDSVTGLAKHVLNSFSISLDICDVGNLLDYSR